MLRVFGFENTGAEESGDRNWRIFDENSQTIRRALSMTLPVTGSPAIDAYFTLYGPIVFFAMRWVFLQGNGWQNNSIIAMPFDALYAGTSKSNYFMDTFEIWSSSSGFIQHAELQFGNQLILGPAYNSPVVSPSTERITIKGWYYRN